MTAEAPTRPYSRGIAVHVRYAGPTDYRGSRWVATADHPIGRAVVPYDYAARSAIDGAKAAAESLMARWARDGGPFDILAGGHLPDGAYAFIVAARS